MTWTAQDHLFMSRALQLARNGYYTCDPNPRVGCVITKENKIIGEGWHAMTGAAHAEINAIAQCDDATDATVYLTLEPCAHQGRTPPCVNALVEAKVREVIIAMIDPNPQVAGNGIKGLEAAGIIVKQGLMEDESITLNPGFIKRMSRGLPYVRCKMAMSLDGRTALANGKSQWISSEQSRQDVHQLRAASSAILTSADNVMKDDARLNVRNVEHEFVTPLRVIIDRQLTISEHAGLFEIPGKVIVFTETNDDQRKEILTGKGVDVICLPASDNWLNQVMSYLASEYEVNEVLIEAGAKFSGAMLEAELVDELVIYMAAMLLGDDARPLVNLMPIKSLNSAIKLQLVDMRQVGKDVRLVYTCNN